MTDETIEMNLAPGNPPPAPLQTRDQQLTQLVASLTGPATSLLRDLSSAAVALLSTMLDDEFERGRRSGLTEVAERARSLRPSPTSPRLPADLAAGPPPNAAAMARLTEAAHRAGQQRRQH